MKIIIVIMCKYRIEITFEFENSLYSKTYKINKLYLIDEEFINDKNYIKNFAIDKFKNGGHHDHSFLTNFKYKITDKVEYVDYSKIKQEKENVKILNLDPYITKLIQIFI